MNQGYALAKGEIIVFFNDIFMGTDVISSDAASLPEVLKEGAIYFENNNLNMLKECLRKYISGEKMVDEETKKQDFDGRFLCTVEKWIYIIF